MKKIFLGFVAGALVTLGATQLIQNSNEYQQNIQQEDVKKENARLDKQEMTKEKVLAKVEDEHPAALVQVVKTTSATENSLTDYMELSRDELIERLNNYQNQVDALTATVTTQQQAIAKLNKDIDNGGTRPQAKDLTEAEAQTALENIRQAITNADPEYKEVLEVALNQYENDLELIAPGNDALIRHYSEEPRYDWSEAAQAFLQSYFQLGIEPNIQLVQLNCRSTYCELYGFYSSSEQLNDYRIPAAKVTKFFQGMQDAPNYKSFFRSAENISLNNDSDNNFMTFHVFIRSAN